MWVLFEFNVMLSSIGVYTFQYSSSSFAEWGLLDKISSYHTSDVKEQLGFDICVCCKNKKTKWTTFMTNGEGLRLWLGNTNTAVYRLFRSNPQSCQCAWSTWQTWNSLHNDVSVSQRDWCHILEQKMMKMKWFTQGEYKVLLCWCKYILSHSLSNLLKWYIM